MLFPYQTLNSLPLNLSLQTLFCVFMCFVTECKCVPTQQRQCGQGNLSMDSPHSESGEWQIRSQPGLHKELLSHPVNQSINQTLKQERSPFVRTPEWDEVWIKILSQPRPTSTNSSGLFFLTGDLIWEPLCYSQHLPMLTSQLSPGSPILYYPVPPGICGSLGENGPIAHREWLY